MDGKRSRRLIVWLLVLIMVNAVPFSIRAEGSTNKIVKDGYLITPGFQDGGEGEYKSGQGYEYLQKIAGYTGWTYEYIYGDFEELFEKLANGEVDIMGNISYTEERAKMISYAQNEEGKEAFYLYVNGADSQINGSNIATINGKKIGVNTNTYQEEIWKNWCRQNRLRCEIVEFASEEKLQAALNNGEIDGAADILMMNRTKETENWRSVLKFGDAPYYFGVSKEKPELLTELNKAQAKILSENPRYNEELSARYLRSENLFSEQLSEEELEWLDKNNGQLKVGCLIGYLPLCDTDKEGNMIGVLPDLFALIQEKYSDYDIYFDLIIYDEYSRLIADLKSGIIDIMAPIYGDYWNADQEGVCLTDSPLSTTMLLLHEGAYSPREIKRIGVDKNSPLQMAYAKIYYSDYEIVLYPSIDDSAKALNAGKIDAALCSACSYHVAAKNNSILRDMNRVTLPGSVNISMAVSKQNPELMSILNRGFSLVGETEIFNSMAMHSNVELTYTLGDYVSNNPISAIIICSVVFIVLSFNIIRLKKAMKRAETDPMTGLLNKVAMREQIREQLSQGGVLFMIDIDNFKAVNDILGHKEGDKVLTLFASNLGRIFRSGDVIGRFGGDEFMVFLPKASFKDEIVESKVNQMQQVLESYNEMAADKRIQCSVSVGVARIKPNEAIGYTEIFEKADAALYAAKKKGKHTFVIAE